MLNQLLKTVVLTTLVCATPMGGCTADEQTDEQTDEATPQVQPSDAIPGAAVTTTDFSAADFRLVLGLGEGDLESASDLVAFVEPKGNARLAANLTTYCSNNSTAMGGFCPTLTIKNQSGNTSPLPAHDNTWAPEQDVLVQAYAAGMPSGSILVIECNSASDSDLATGINKAIQLGAKVVAAGWTLPTASATNVHSAISGAAAGIRFRFPVASVPDGNQGGQASPTAPTDLAKVQATGGMTITVDGSTVTRALWSNSTSGYVSGVSKPSAQSDFYSNGYLAFPVSVNVAKGGRFRVATSSSASADQTLDGNAIATALDVVGHALDANYDSPFPLSSGRKIDLDSGNNGGCGTLCQAASGQDAPTVLGQITAK